MIAKEQKKHLVIICPECAGIGAVANVALHHCRELSKHYRATLISNNVPPLGDGVGYVQVNAASFDFLRRYSHVPRELAFAKQALKKLIALHKTKPIDVVMCHGHVVASIAANRFKRVTGVPYVLVTHGDIFDRPIGTYDSRLTWLYKKVTPAAYQHADLIVALSPHMQDMAIRSLASAEQVAVIPNGVDARDIGLDSEPLPEQALLENTLFELLYVGRLSVEKGVDTLLEACALLAANGGQFRLRVCGSGPQEANLRKQVNALKLSDKVQFIGQVARPQMGALYRSAHYVCVPSRSDSLPTVVLEALLSATPVIGADVGGIPFSIEHDVTGLLFPSGDSNALKQQLCGASDSLHKLHDMRANCRRVAVQRFSWTTTGRLLNDRIRHL